MSAGSGSRSLTRAEFWSMLGEADRAMLVELQAMAGPCRLDAAWIGDEPPGRAVCVVPRLEMFYKTKVRRAKE